ncbi:MAG TPA: TonB-dependent receptor [Albitalea sp.]|uniref:TonB-dependent receptor n=1 Tax=Piscinibacter sp. TaxID=1903157 RepID=UPI002ED4C7C5
MDKHPGVPLRRVVAALALAALTWTASAQPRPFNLPGGDLKASLDAYAAQSGVQVVYRVEELEGLATSGFQGAATPEEALTILLRGTPLHSKRDTTNAVVVFRAVSFNIPPQEAGSALNAFATQAGVAVDAPSDVVSGRRTEGLSGVFPVGEGLGRLLGGTGLVGSSDDGAHFTIRSVAKGDVPVSLETVMITAQKRPEASQDVPISLTALSSKTLEDYQVRNLKDVSRLTPGLLVSAFSQNNPTIAIRGVSNTFSQIGVSKPVALVVDDVFIPRNSAASFDLFDLDSIVVLKGPQGTLFGRNVTGGAIVIDTHKPSFDKRELQARATIGNFNERRLDAYGGVPINDSAAIKISASRRVRDGYGRDRLTGSEQDDIDSQNYRAQLRLMPSATLEALLSVDHSRDANGGRTLSSTSLGDDGDRRTSELGVKQGFARTISGASARLAWAIGGGELTSITAYRRSASAEDYSGVGTNFSFLTTGSQSVVHDADHLGTFSQELRYASPDSTRGNFVVGFYYLSEKGTRQLGTQGLAAITGAVASSTLGDQRVDTVSHAVFADGTVHLPASLDLSAGVRYTFDEKTASLLRTDLVQPANTFNTEGLRQRWHQWTPRVALTWHATRNAIAYLSMTRGFTAGGFNADASSAAAFATPFNPEKVTNYELGTKTDWLENRLRFNLSVFRMKYKDKQELVNNQTTRILTITNASAATVKGAELHLAARPVRWLNVSLNYANLDATYDQFVAGTVNNTGNPLGSAPRNTYSVAADVNVPVATWASVVGTISYVRTDEYYTGATKDPNLLVPGYGLANASVGIDLTERRVRILAWVRNAADTKYILTRSTQVVRSEYLGEPRTYGITIDAKF